MDLWWFKNIIMFVLQALRSLEGNEAQVCFFIIQLLLLKPSDFRNRVRDFVNDVSGRWWNVNHQQP